jgi:hypothetical protein
MVVYPYYALFQVLVLPPLGALYYAKSWYRNGTLKPPGRYRIGFLRETLDMNAGASLRHALGVLRENLPARSGKQVVEALRARQPTPTGSSPLTSPAAGSTAGGRSEGQDLSRGAALDPRARPTSCYRP